MHELSVCQAILAQVEGIAAEHQAHTVNRITLFLGPLAGIEAHLLQQAFPIAAAGTVAQQAQLVIEATPIKVQCRSCQAISEVKANSLVCTQCGAWQTTLVSGDALVLASVDLGLSSPPSSHLH